MCLICAGHNPTDPLTALDQHIVASDQVATAQYTLDQIAAQLATGFWGTGRSYSFQLDASRSLTYNVVGLTAPEQAIAIAALEAWTEVTGIRFIATIGAAQITFDNNDSGAYAQFRTSNGFIVNSFINIEQDWFLGLNINNYNLQAYMHEIGHALCLGHAGNYNGSATYGIDNHYSNGS